MTTQPTEFVPQDLDAQTFENLEPLYQDLVNRELDSLDALQQWLSNLCALSVVVSEHHTKLHIDSSCHTDDEAIEAAMMDYTENVQPKVKQVFFELQRKFLNCPHHKELKGDKYDALARSWQAEVGLFRESNIALQRDEVKIENEWSKLSGALSVEVDGQEYTLQQAAKFLQDTDRSKREHVWRSIEERRSQDREAIEDIYDRLCKLRGDMASNADLPNFRAYQWQRFERFDYSPDDCHHFADGVEKACVPVLRTLFQKRAADLGLDKLRPWDLDVDPLNRPALAPFPSDDTSVMVDGCQRIFDRLSPELGDLFRSLKPGRNLDLDSRKGKRPGGYHTFLEKTGESFIFMNAAGLDRDVRTMLHEAGHAFHGMVTRDEPLTFVRHAPMEFCEVASMTMELLALPFLDEFYDEADVRRATDQQFEGIVRVLVWIATIDQFQHWVYTHPQHTQADRTQAWLDIRSRFDTGMIDWSGIESSHANMWQRQIHLFHYPFYYIEYGIAQLGSLQLWKQSLNDVDEALTNYMNGLKLGGTRSLARLFEATNINFDFSIDTIQPIMSQIQSIVTE